MNDTNITTTNDSNPNFRRRPKTLPANIFFYPASKLIGFDLLDHFFHDFGLALALPAGAGLVFAAAARLLLLGVLALAWLKG